MDNKENLFLFLDDTAEIEYIKKYGKTEPPKTKEDEKILEDLKIRFKNGEFNLE